MDKIKLTQYSHGAGCGCKISPGVLSEILKSNESLHFPNLLVGYEHRDDAAVLDLGDGTAIISTTDFFMPIVDDAYDFGRVASVNAISDVYAMGGTPLMAIGILGWPIDKLSADVASMVLEGARQVCKEANIPLAGGHSIDSPEPIFGLAVTGRVPISNLKTNAGARLNDKIYITKKLGVGILTTAEKKGILAAEDHSLALESMVQLNSIGAKLATLDYVHSITDVTGFGLAGHAIEMAEASNLLADINYVNLPWITEALQNYIDMKAIPGGTIRNWKSYNSKTLITHDSYINIIADPQTSGGLLVSVDSNYTDMFEAFMESEKSFCRQIGSFIEYENNDIRLQLK